LTPARRRLVRIELAVLMLVMLAVATLVTWRVVHSLTESATDRVRGWMNDACASVVESTGSEFEREVLTHDGFLREAARVQEFDCWGASGEIFMATFRSPETLRRALATPDSGMGLCFRGRLSLSYDLLVQPSVFTKYCDNLGWTVYRHEVPDISPPASSG